MKKLLISVISGLALVASSAFAIDIIVVSHGQASDPFWSVAKNGVDRGAKEARVKVQYRSPATFDMVEMSKLIDAAVAQKPDGLVVTIPDADALGPSIRRAVQAGIPVVSMNSGSDVYKKLGVSVHVGQTEYEAGLGGGERMKASGAKRALCINHEVGNVALDLRCEGFKKGFGGNVRILSVNGQDATAVKNAVLAAMKRDSKVDAVLSLGPIAALPTLDALKTVGKLGQIQFGSFDLAPETLEATARGDMSFLIDQQQFLQGYLPIIILANNAKYQAIPSGLVMTGPGFVTPQNAKEVISLSKKGLR